MTWAALTISPAAIRRSTSACTSARSRGRSNATTRHPAEASSRRGAFRPGSLASLRTARSPTGSGGPKLCSSFRGSLRRPRIQSRRSPDRQPWTQCGDRSRRICRPGETIQSYPNMRFGLSDYQLHHGQPMVAAGKTSRNLYQVGWFIRPTPKAEFSPCANSAEWQRQRLHARPKRQLSPRRVAMSS